MFAEDSPWPPKPYEHVMAACAERQVWWEGDPDKLAAFYGGSQGDVVRSKNVTQRARKAWASFWGKQQTVGERPTRVHAPIAADIARIAAATLFADPPQILAPAHEVTEQPEPEAPTVNPLTGTTIEPKPVEPIVKTVRDQALQDAIDALSNNPRTHAGYLEAAESASMLMGAYGRVVWDKNLFEDGPWIDWVDADRAIPEFVWDRLVAVTFWTELASDSPNVVWRHLQRYEKGREFHSLHQGTRDKLGQAMELTAHPATAPIAARKGLTENGFEVPTDFRHFMYAPNMGSNPAWRNDDNLRPLGRADLDTQVMRLMDEADKVWSSWMRDLDLGKARVFISRQLLTNGRSGEGASFDVDRSIFSLVGDGVDKGDMSTIMDAQQFAIRVEEHARTYEGLLRLIIARCGYSPLTFGLSDEVAQTATETDAKTRDTHTTRRAKILHWSELDELHTAMLQINAAVFGGPAVSEKLELKWPASKESPRVLAETANLLRQAQAASTKTLVEMQHPDWTDDQVETEVELIDNASSVDVPAFGGGFGGNEQPDPNADPAETEGDSNEAPPFGE